MKVFYRAKFNELFMEFTRYLITHPDFGGNIPKGAEVILLDRLDPGYSRFMLEKAPKDDDEHPVVFIDVGELAECVNELRHENSEFSHSNGSAYSQASFV